LHALAHLAAAMLLHSGLAFGFVELAVTVGVKLLHALTHLATAPLHGGLAFALVELAIAIGVKLLHAPLASTGLALLTAATEFLTATTSLLTGLPLSLTIAPLAEPIVLSPPLTWTGGWLGKGQTTTCD
jgi:hypothetical protein